MRDVGEEFSTRFECECYDIGHLYTLAHFVGRKLIKRHFGLGTRAVDHSYGGNVHIIDHALNDLGGVIHALEAQIRIDFASRYGFVILDVASKPLVARARDDEDMVLRVVADRLPHARPDIVWCMTMDIAAVIGVKPGFDDAAVTTHFEEISVPGEYSSNGAGG